MEKVKVEDCLYNFLSPEERGRSVTLLIHKHLHAAQSYGGKLDTCCSINVSYLSIFIDK